MEQASKEDVPSRKQRLSIPHIRHGAVIGAMITIAIVIIIGSMSSGLSGKNEGDNVLVIIFGLFVMLIFAPLQIITAIITGRDFEIYWLAMPWHYALGHFFREDTSIALGFIINGALIGAFIAHFKWRKQVRKHV